MTNSKDKNNKASSPNLSPKVSEAYKKRRQQESDQMAQEFLAALNRGIQARKDQDSQDKSDARSPKTHKATLEDAMRNPAPIIEYADFSREMPLECPVCHWKGKAGDGDIEHYQDLMDVSCPKCEKMLLVINYPFLRDYLQDVLNGGPESLH